MNKTVNINLAGFFFHIDENAYQKLSNYFEAIKRSLSGDGKEEIMKDIESRIAELFLEKKHSENKVISIVDVEFVISLMGQPEDYKIEDAEPTKQTFTYNTLNQPKKLYRDKDGGIIGGVLSGLGYYIGVDRVWLRIIMAILILSFGIGFIPYLILWIVIPEAKTTSEKLVMRGEPINISNIEKKVRSEFDAISNKIKSTDYDKFGNQIKTNIGGMGSSISDIIKTIFLVISKIIGGILVLTGLVIIMFLLVGIFTLGTNIFIDFPWQSFVESGNFSNYPIWSFGLLMFFAVGIPFLFLTMLGFKLLSPSFKSLGNTINYTLVAIWIIAIALCISIGINQATAFAYDGRVVSKTEIHTNPKDTLFIKFAHNNMYAKNIEDTVEFKIMQDSNNVPIIYSNEVSIKIEKTEERFPYIQIEKESCGKSIQEATQKAKNIQYHFKIDGNNIIFDNYLITELKNKFREQEVEIILFLPNKTLFKVDSSIERYDYSDNDFFDLHYDTGTYNYKLTQNKVECLNCPDSDTEINVDSKVFSNSPNVTINKDGISIKNDTTISDKDIKELKISKDGIIIKTE